MAKKTILPTLLGLLLFVVAFASSTKIWGPVFHFLHPQEQPLVTVSFFDLFWINASWALIPAIATKSLHWHFIPLITIVVCCVSTLATLRQKKKASAVNTPHEEARR
jgi:hypothetical protein